jgi:hypothetical protein
MPSLPLAGWILTGFMTVEVYYRRPAKWCLWR